MMKEKRSGFWCLNRDMVFLIHTLNPNNDRLFTQYTNLRLHAPLLDNCLHNRLGYMLLFWITV